MAIVNKLLKLYQSEPEEIELLIAEVTGVDPLQLVITADKKRIISENIIVIPKHLTNYEVEADLECLEESELNLEVPNVDSYYIYDPNPNTFRDKDYDHEHSIEEGKIKMDDFTLEVLNCLEENDIVIVLSFNNGNLFYVVDRIN